MGFLSVILITSVMLGVQC